MKILIRSELIGFNFPVVAFTTKISISLVLRIQEIRPWDQIEGLHSVQGDYLVQLNLETVKVGSSFEISFLYTRSNGGWHFFLAVHAMAPPCPLIFRLCSLLPLIPQGIGPCGRLSSWTGTKDEEGNQRRARAIWLQEDPLHQLDRAPGSGGTRIWQPHTGNEIDQQSQSERLLLS